MSTQRGTGSGTAAAKRALLVGAGTGSQSSNLGVDDHKFRHEVANSSSESLVLQRELKETPREMDPVSNLSLPFFKDRGKMVQITDPREVQFISSAAGKCHNFKDDRIMLTTRKTPFCLFSVLPYHKGKENRKDPRRRHASGARPLSSINDAAFDPFDLLGIHRGESGQEVSYGHLLVASKLYAKDRKHGGGAVIPESMEITNYHAMKNHGVARYVMKGEGGSGRSFS